jgi:hypothetical protein
MRRPRRPGAPYKLIMQTNCAALIFIRHRKRPLSTSEARVRRARFRTKVGAIDVSMVRRVESALPPAQERAERGMGSARLRGNRGNRRRKLVKFCNSIAVQTRAMYAAGGLCCLVAGGFC